MLILSSFVLICIYVYSSRRRTSYSPRPYGGRGRGGGRSPPNGIGDRTPPTELSPEERDARTVFCIQLSQRVRARDLEEFFSSVGKVRDVRLITCNKTKRFKGIAYIEFEDPESVALALGLSGQRLLGVPIMVQHTQAEKNRLQSAPPPFQPKAHTGPMRLYVGSLHFNITEDMLRGIFEPFGKIDAIQLIMDTETGRSKGYGFITVQLKALYIFIILIIYIYLIYSITTLMMPKRLWNN